MKTISFLIMLGVGGFLLLECFDWVWNQCMGHTTTVLEDCCFWGVLSGFVGTLLLMRFSVAPDPEDVVNTDSENC
jgi:hypothetical protein